ncbi:MAG: alpha/beta hydrolase [Bacteroidota bacterium]
MIHENQLEVAIKASYYTLNELTNQTERVWLVFHGQGQLAQYFIKKFEVLDARKNFVIAPQGLSKYYLQGFSGRVGASWMTKEDRLTEIANQYTYVKAVLDQFDINGKSLIYFGFSQGAATVGRFAASAKISFEKMILWAGTFPPDTSPEEWNYLSGTEEAHYYFSKEDVFFKEGMVDQQKQVIKTATGLDPALHWYEGGHRVISELLHEI